MEFVKGHMGGNLILLAHAKDFDEQRELEQALSLLSNRYLTGHQAGLLYPARDGGSLAVRIISCSWQDYIPACGGLTQVLGTALAQTSLGAPYGIDLATSSAPVEIVLECECGPVPISVETSATGVTTSRTNLLSFARETLRSGVEDVVVDDVPITRVGTFMVVDADAIKARYKGVDFEKMDGETTNVFAALQRRFQQHVKVDIWNVALFDRRAAVAGRVRVLFPHSVLMGHIEAACGTGSVALALALAAKEPPADAREFCFETGGEAVLGGPDCTTVQLEYAENGVISSATFSHSNVEIVATGTITTLP